MPAKRVVAHTICGACGASLPLEGVVTVVTCIVCSRAVEITRQQWQWVLDEPPRRALPDEIWRALRLSRVYPFTVWRAGQRPRRSDRRRWIGRAALFAAPALVALAAGGVLLASRARGPSGFGMVGGPCNGVEHAC